MSNTIEAFEQIIRYQGAEKLLPFLLALNKQEIIAIRKRVQTLASELENVRQKGEQHWEKGPTHLQNSLFFLTRLATYSQKEALAPAFANSLWVLNESLFPSTKNEFLPPNKLMDYVCQLLIHRRPEWLDTWLGNTANGRPLRSLDFDFLIRLESYALIVPTARLLALSGVTELFHYGTKANSLRQLHGYLKTGVKLTASQLANFTQIANAFSWLHEGEPLPAIEDLIFERIARNKRLLERAIPQFFEFDTEINWGFAQTGDHGDRRWISWHDVLARLTASGHLDRADILTRCLLALRRDFRRPLLTWFKELFLALHPTPAERLARQTELTELLAHPLPLVVNFALDQLKDLWTEPTFRLDALLLYAEGLLTRQDLKTGIRTLLSGFGKLLKRHPAQAPTLARLYTAALAHADGAVQERAARGLANILQAKKPLLTPAETAETTDHLCRYAELLGPAARALMAPWLAAAEETATPAEPAEAYAPLTDFQPEISPATAIVPVADWHELLFLTGQVLKHDDPPALERWVDGLLRLQGHFPAGYAGQLGPYLAQVLPQLKKAAAAEQVALLTGPVTIYGHAGLAVALLLSWATGFATPRVGEVRLASPHLACPPLLGIEQERYGLAEARLRAKTGAALPLLSTPTHRPYWIAPSALVNKLLAYQEAGLAPASADLAVALARTAHAHPAEAAEALRRLPELAQPALLALLTWFFGPVGQPLPALGGAAGGRAGAGLQASAAEALPELWAVAARTKAPAGIFATLSAALGYDYAGVTQPLRSTFEAVARENCYPDPAQPAQVGSYRFVDLAWSSGAVGAAPSPLLLYAPPVGKSEAGSWEENSLLTNNLSFMAALLPNYAAPVYDQVLRCAAWADNLETTERDVLAEALRTLLGPGPAFAAAATAVLASGLIHHTPPCRSLGQEVLLQAIAHGRLLPDELGYVLGRQLATGYAPVPRLASNILAIKGLDARTDDALRQTLDALLPELPAAAPRNTAKLLEAYADLVGRTRRPVPPAVRARLREWEAMPALKKVAAMLLAPGNS